jgi:hypothetical protein
VSALAKWLPDLPPYSESWVQILICKTATEACFFNECSQCQNAAKLRELVTLPDNATEIMVDRELWMTTVNDVWGGKQTVKAKTSSPLHQVFTV